MECKPKWTQGHSALHRADRAPRPESGPVTRELLRKIPITKLLATAMKTPLVYFKIGEPPPGGGAKIEPPTSVERAKFYESYAQGARRPRRGSPLTDDNLDKVAKLYRSAVERGDPPTQTVADQMQVARSTAARWVSAARSRGLLGPAVPGRGGEGGRRNGPNEGRTSERAGGDAQGRDLDTIATEIREAVEATETSLSDSLAHAIRTGEWLTEAKSRVKHGEWMRWLEANFRGTPSDRQRLHAVAAQRRPNRKRVLNSGCAQVTGRGQKEVDDKRPRA